METEGLVPAHCPVGFRINLAIFTVILFMGVDRFS
jgi:hypothetical protein